MAIILTIIIGTVLGFSIAESLVMLGRKIERLNFKSNSKELLEMNAELAKDNVKLKERSAKAIEKIYCWGEVLPSDFQKEMLEILKGDFSNDKREI